MLTAILLAGASGCGDCDDADVSGTFDAVTPASTGRAVAPTLTNSSVPAFPGSDMP